MTKTSGILFDFVFMTIFAVIYSFHTSFEEFSTSTISFSHLLLNFLLEIQPSEKEHSLAMQNGAWALNRILTE